MMGSWCSGILSEIMFLQNKREAVIAGEAIRSSKGGYVSRFRGKCNCSLFFLACGLNELEPDYVGHYCSLTTRRDSPRGVLPYKRLMGMCRWMGSHFHDWIDYNGVAFSKELLEWGRTFSDFWGKRAVHIYG